MEEFYIQNLGEKRIVKVLKWNYENALIQDIKSNLVYPIKWSLFFKHHTKLEKVELNIDDYEGPNLDITK
jgi:hypothetical protein